MKLGANYGDVSVSLPRYFRGPINVRTGDGRIALSPALKECSALISDTQHERVYFIGERPRRGKWHSDDGDDEDGTPEEPLDELSVYGGFTSTRIRWDGEEELPEMGLDGWTSFCSGTARFFTSGRVF
jgi:hypothetical protein